MSKRNRSKSSEAKPNKPGIFDKIFSPDPIEIDPVSFQENLAKHKAGSRKEQRR